MMPDKSRQIRRLKGIKPEIIVGDWPEVQEIIRVHFAGKSGSALVTMHPGICLGIFAEDRFVIPSALPLNPAYIRSVRIFDDSSECYVWKNDLNGVSKFHLRLRKDQELEDSKSEFEEAVEAKQLLWGNRLENCPDKDWFKLKDNRGIELLIHNSFAESPDFTKNVRLWLITRNYIGYNLLGQAGYVDSRFLRIETEGRRNR